MTIDREKLLNLFNIESLDNLQALENGLLDLEKKGEDQDLLKTLMRITHTIKGSASLLGLKSIEQINHALEDAFTNLIDGSVQLSKSRMNTLLEATDFVHALLENRADWKGNSIDDLFIQHYCAQIRAEFPENPNKEQFITVPDTSVVEQEKVIPNHITDSGSVHRAAFEHESIRVDTKRLNTLVNLAGEQLVSKIQLEESMKQLNALLTSDCSDIIHDTMTLLNEVVENLSLSISRMQQEIMDIRMIPISSLFYSFPRGIRELAQEKEKEVELIIHGEETELDKSIVDQLREPMLHLLRNAVDHGIESPDERAESGKNRTGEIHLAAFQKGAQIKIELSDDGRGVNTSKVSQSAIAKELITEDGASTMSDDELYQLLFTPGFSTKESVDTTSGRGVGLDVVKEKITDLKGTIDISSDVGFGTTFHLSLPLTLAITEVLMIAVGAETYAIPIDGIQETVRIGIDEITTIETKEAIVLREEVIPLVRLLELFSLEKKGISEETHFTVVVVQSFDRKIALLADSLIERQGIISKPLQYPLRNVQYISGATVLGNGKVVLIIDIAQLADSSDSYTVQKRKSLPQKERVSGKSKKILIAEDSMTTALLEKSVLESAGFKVVIAQNGKEALHLAQQELFDLVVSDVLMPEMDGFELTEKLKSDQLYKDIPIIIVTTRESREDKIRGLQAGASAYLLKKEFTSDGLLTTIDRLLQ